MKGLAGMNEEGRGARRGHRRGDLAPDVAGLAHAADDDAARAAQDQLDRTLELGPEPG